MINHDIKYWTVIGFDRKWLLFKGDLCWLSCKKFTTFSEANKFKDGLWWENLDCFVLLVVTDKQEQEYIDASHKSKNSRR